MALFGKKNKEEDSQKGESEDSGGVAKVGVKALKKNNFKDLNPSDKMARREPKKPWGKFERFFVLATIVLTAGTSAYLGLSSRNWKLPGFPRLNSINISLPNLWGEETIVIEGNEKDNLTAGEIVNEFKMRTQELTGVYGLYVVMLKNNASFGVNESEPFTSASLIKLPLMAAMYLESESGRLDLSDKYILKDADKVAGAGSLRTRPQGYEITYENLVMLMGKESDNTAFAVTRKIISDSKINDMALKIGMIQTRVQENKTTPKDVGTFFQELWHGNVVGESSREKIFNYLSQTRFENWITKGIPSEIRVIHKYGREVHVINDAGIIQAENPYVLVILSKGVKDSEADKFIPEFSEFVYTKIAGS